MTAPALPPPPPTGGLIDRWLFQLWQKVITNTVAGRLLATFGLTVSGDTFISRGITDNATTTALTIGPTGLIGVGVSPSSYTIGKTVEFGYSGLAAWGAGVNNFQLTSNLYYDGSHKFAGTGYANSIHLGGGSGYVAINGSTASGSAGGAATMAEYFRVGLSGEITLGGSSSAPALKVSPVASQDRWVTATASAGGNPEIGTSAGDLAITSNIVNAPAYSNTTANAPNIYIDSNGKHYRSTFAVGGAVGGTVTSVGLAVPTGMSVSGTPVTGSGTITISLADDLAAVEAISTTGFVKRTALDTWSTAASIDLTADVTGDLPVTNLAGGTLDQGYSATPYNAGTKSSGTFTPDEANGNFQYCVNGGAFTLAPPTNNCTLVLQVTNNGSAGTITTSGFTKVSGYVPTTTNGDDFIAFITKINGFSHLAWQELQ